MVSPAWAEGRRTRVGLGLLASPGDSFLGLAGGVEVRDPRPPEPWRGETPRTLSPSRAFCTRVRGSAWVRGRESRRTPPAGPWWVCDGLEQSVATGRGLQCLMTIYRKSLEGLTLEETKLVLEARLPADLTNNDP